jgi:hypothetical protein
MRADAFPVSGTFPVADMSDVRGLVDIPFFVSAGSAPFLMMEDLSSEYQVSPTATHNGGVWASKRLRQKLAILARKVQGATELANAELFVAKAWTPAAEGTAGNCKATNAMEASAPPTLHDEGRALGMHPSFFWGHRHC